MDETGERALRALRDMAARTERAGASFAPGTAQHTLQHRRLAALRTAELLLAGREVAPEAMEAARAPLASLLSKSEKALGKLAEGTWQRRMLEENVWALRAVMERGFPPA